MPDHHVTRYQIHSATGNPLVIGIGRVPFASGGLGVEATFLTYAEAENYKRDHRELADFHVHVVSVGWSTPK